jgi:hypothetical protein
MEVIEECSQYEDNNKENVVTSGLKRRKFLPSLLPPIPPINDQNSVLRNTCSKKR